MINSHLNNNSVRTIRDPWLRLPPPPQIWPFLPRRSGEGGDPPDLPAAWNAHQQLQMGLLVLGVNFGMDGARMWNSGPLVHEKAPLAKIPGSELELGTSSP